MIVNKKTFWFLIIADLLMAVAALSHDWADFSQVPFYLIPLVPICPLYPLFLAINFIIYKKRCDFCQPILHFTAIGIISYGIMAYIFYPYYMVLKGFYWYELGNLLWVSLYAAQFFLVLPFLKRINLWWYVLFASYFFLKDFLDRFGDTFSYQRLDEFTQTQSNILFAMIVILHASALIFTGWRGTRRS